MGPSFWTWRPYIPLALEGFQIYKGPGDGVIAQIGLVLLQQTIAYLGVFSFRNGVFDIGLLQAVESNDDAINLREGIIQILFRGGLCKLHFLGQVHINSGCASRLVVGSWKMAGMKFQERIRTG